MLIVVSIMFSTLIPKIVYNGGGEVNTIWQDQATEIVDLKLTENIANVTLLVPTEIDDIYVNISSPVPPVVGNSLCLKENRSFYQGDINDVVSLGGNNYQLEMDQPLDHEYSLEGGCSIRNNDWAVDGSNETRVFSVSPFGLNEDIEWDITRVILVCLGDGVSGPTDVPDMSSFMTTDSLDNGIVFRHVDGVTKNLFAAKDNFHLVSEAYDLTLYPKNRFGFYATTFRRTFNGHDKNGVVIRLKAIDNDMFQLLIRDDLTDMEECHAVVQGHVTD